MIFPAVPDAEGKQSKMMSKHTNKDLNLDIFPPKQTNQTPMAKNQIRFQFLISFVILSTRQLIKLS